VILLKNCRLVSELTESFTGESADLLIDEGVIKELRVPGCGASTACETFDLKNATLLPGLFDLHAHLGCFNQSPADILTKSPLESAFLAYSFAKSYLKQGYTTVRDCGSNYYTAVYVREAINKGIVPGPRIITSGLIITPTETGNGTFGPLYVEADGADEVLKACRNEFKNGADFIKYMASGAFLNEGGAPGQTIVSFDELCAAVELAASKNSYVAAHAHGADSIKLCIRAGVRTIEHATFIDDGGIEMLKGAKDCYIIPTIAIDKALCDKDFPPDLARIRIAYDSGIEMGWGSDIDHENFEMNPGLEFSARKELLGFDNIEMLKQATIYSARCIGLDDKLGTIKENKVADLIAVDGNPDADIYAMEKDLLMVMKSGKIAQINI